LREERARLPRQFVLRCGYFEVVHGAHVEAVSRSALRVPGSQFLLTTTSSSSSQHDVLTSTSADVNVSVSVTTQQNHDQNNIHHRSMIHFFTSRTTTSALLYTQEIGLTSPHICCHTHYLVKLERSIVHYYYENLYSPQMVELRNNK